MNNSHVIAINGFRRGGTNILWNIFQSHPSVCSPLYETGEIIKGNYRLLSPQKYLFYHLLRTKHSLIQPINKIAVNMLQKKFYNYKKMNLDHIDNRYKYENISYNEKEIAKSSLCLKSVNKDIDLTGFLSTIYDNIYFVGLVRNGYALCESWLRRGFNPISVGKFYLKYCIKMIKDSEKYNNYIILRFEDLIQSPFEQSIMLYKFSNLKPTKLKKLRLKSKNILSTNGTHEPKFGTKNRKYWFSPQEILSYFEPNISLLQSEMLSNMDKKAFEKEAKPVLEYFHYLQ